MLESDGCLSPDFRYFGPLGPSSESESLEEEQLSYPFFEFLCGGPLSAILSNLVVGLLSVLFQLGKRIESGLDEIVPLRSGVLLVLLSENVLLARFVRSF